MHVPQFVARSAVCVVLAGLACSCGNSAGSLPMLPPVPNNQYVLGAGDQVRVYVYGIEAFNNTAAFTVGDDGAVSLPMIDKVPARGKTYAALEDGIRQALIQHQILTAPIVNVQPVALRPFYILGEVAKPGEYTFRPGMSVLAAVSMAGGFTYRADQGHVGITRDIDGRPVVGRAEASDAIRPGDQIQVYERWF